MNRFFLAFLCFFRILFGKKLPSDVKRFLPPEEEKKALPVPEKPVVTWIHVIGLHETQILKKFGDLLKLHPLVLEDILNTDQRPKLEDYGEYLYIVLKSLSLNNGNGKSSPNR